MYVISNFIAASYETSFQLREDVGSAAPAVLRLAELDTLKRSLNVPGDDLLGRA
jgi:hypothetical protein